MFKSLEGCGRENQKKLGFNSSNSMIKRDIVGLYVSFLLIATFHVRLGQCRFAFMLNLNSDTKNNQLSVPLRSRSLQ